MRLFSKNFDFLKLNKVEQFKAGKSNRTVSSQSVDILKITYPNVLKE